MRASKNFCIEEEADAAIEFEKLFCRRGRAIDGGEKKVEEVVATSFISGDFQLRLFGNCKSMD